MKAKIVTIHKEIRVICPDDASDDEIYELALGNYASSEKIAMSAARKIKTDDIEISDDHDEPFGSGEGEPDVYILPSCYASALINNDFSGLSDEDEKELDEWFNRVKPGLCVGCSSESYFTHGHDMNRNQGADVLEYYFNKPTY